MNNARGTDLMQRIRLGCLVSIRLPSGARLMGRPVPLADGNIYLRSVLGRDMIQVTESNILAVAIP